MKCLVIDTSSHVASVAALDDGRIIGEFTVKTERTHSQRLMPMVDALLDQMGGDLSDFDAFAVCEGPGSFTGVRIGISTVKAFAQVYKKPIYTVSSMCLVAGNVSYHDGLVVSVLDANKSQVYYGIYRFEGGVLTVLTEDSTSLEALFEVVEAAYSGESVIFVGDGLEKYGEAFSALLSVASEKRNRYRLASPVDNAPRASSFARVLHAAGEPVDYLSAKANYMKKSQAERDIT